MGCFEATLPRKVTLSRDGSKQYRNVSKMSGKQVGTHSTLTIYQEQLNGTQRKKKESLVTKPSLLKESLIIPE